MSVCKKASGPLLLLVLPVLILGCSKHKLDDPEVAARYGVLRQIHELYSAYAKNYQKPPQKLADLDKKEYEGLYPGTLKAVKDGSYVVIWGVDVSGKDSGKVLAYEKAAPTEGGAVITADCIPKIMSADELKAALGK
jgi:hypothetical protein